MKKTMTALDNLLHWVISSSANPAAVSLTLKGFLVMLVPIILSISGMSHLNLGSAQVNMVIGSLVYVVQIALTLVGAITALIGAVRKIWLTIIPAKVAPAVPINTVTPPPPFNSNAGGGGASSVTPPTPPTT